MKKYILCAVIAISSFLLSSYAMEQDSTAGTKQVGIEHVPKDVLALILAYVAPQNTLEEALKSLIEAPKLRSVSKAFRDALPMYQFTIQQLAKKFNMPTRAIALRLIRLLKERKKITQQQIKALLARYRANNELTQSLYDALVFGDASKIKELLDKNANVNIVVRDKLTPLGYFIATSSRRNAKKVKDIIRLLIDYGAIVNKIIIDLKGSSPLMWAITMGPDYNDIVELLLKSGADVNAQDNQGNTALKLAIEEKREDMVDLLKHYGAH